MDVLEIPVTVPRSSRARSSPRRCGDSDPVVYEDEYKHDGDEDDLVQSWTRRCVGSCFLRSTVTKPTPTT